MGRDAPHYIWLLRAPSNLPQNTSRDGAPTIPPDNLFQGFTILWVKNFFLTPNLNLFSFSLKSLSCIKLFASIKSLSTFYNASLGGRCCEVSLKSSLLQLSNPSYLSPESCSRPLVIFVALIWTLSNRSTAFLCWLPQSWIQVGHSTLSQGQSRVQNSLPYPGQVATLLLGQPGLCLAFWAVSTPWWLMSNFSSNSNVMGKQILSFKHKDWNLSPFIF